MLPSNNGSDRGARKGGEKKIEKVVDRPQKENILGGDEAGTETPGIKHSSKLWALPLEGADRKAARRMIPRFSASRTQSLFFWRLKTPWGSKMENTAKVHELSEDTVFLIFDSNFCFGQSDRAVGLKLGEIENVFDYFGKKTAREKLRDELRIQIRLAFAGAKESELPLEALCDLLDEIDDLFCELWADSEEYRQNRKKVERDCFFWSSYLRDIEFAVQKQNTDVFFSLFANFKRELKHNGLEIPPTLGRLFRRAIAWWDRSIERTVRALLRIDDLQCDLLASARTPGDNHKTVAIANKIRKEWAHVKHFSPSLAA